MVKLFPELGHSSCLLGRAWLGQKTQFLSTLLVECELNFPECISFSIRYIKILKPLLL